MNGAFCSGMEVGEREGSSGPNQTLRQTPAAFWFLILQRLSSGRRC
jgi:hypothetical protein